MKAPEQTEAIRVPAAAAARSASSASAGGGGADSAQPGTTTVSASASPSRPQGARTAKVSPATSEPGEQTRSR
jgi:hypothetical protein